MNRKTSPLAYYIGHVCDAEHRFKASSGGIGSMLQKYLLSTGQYGTSITFHFNVDSCMYEAKMIHTAGEVNICGSVYQDIDIAHFIRDHIKEIYNGIVLSCPPCQVTVIRKMLQKENIPCFIISFCCSGQTTIDGTWKYYELLGIRKEEVARMQYRGNGWPSGIQIWLKDGTKIYRDNYTEPWKTLHASKIFWPNRCKICGMETSYKADISLADPWLKEYISKDSKGNTLFIVNTDRGCRVIKELYENSFINFSVATYNSFYTAQQSNVEKKQRLIKKKSKSKFLERMLYNHILISFFSKDIMRMKLYVRLCHLELFWIISNKLPNMKIFQKLKIKFRYIQYARIVGKHDGFFTIGKNVILHNPKYLYLGKGVSIGSGSIINPVISHLSHKYTPAIIIGDNTFVNEDCSISSIVKVEIGKNVLFARQVHITDHSHGYDNINIPVSSQQLITKGPIIIDDDCWLGYGCEILSGVHIGRHSVVAARAVVVKDVPAYCVVAGNPARVVKKYNIETKVWEKVKRQ